MTTKQLLQQSAPRRERLAGMRGQPAPLSAPQLVYDIQIKAADQFGLRAALDHLAAWMVKRPNEPNQFFGAAGSSVWSADTNFHREEP